jgi:PAB-dependent poly(A)-specific ribonuclease subunit 3
VFHQTDDKGHPWLDFGHIIESLNKLDIGSDEKILLTSRDERSILVVSFADVKKCLEETFQEILPIQYRSPPMTTQYPIHYAYPR